MSPRTVLTVLWALRQPVGLAFRRRETLSRMWIWMEKAMTDQPTMETGTVGPTPPTEPLPKKAPGPWRDRLITVVLAAIVAAAVSFGVGALHPGPQGKAGTTGKTGKTGLTGLTGPSGSAAQVTGLGVCFNTNFGGDGVYTWVSSVSINSPTVRADGTTYCSYGSYVPVAPQPING